MTTHHLLSRLPNIVLGTALVTCACVRIDGEVDTSNWVDSDAGASDTQNPTSSHVSGQNSDGDPSTTAQSTMSTPSTASTSSVPVTTSDATTGDQASETQTEPGASSSEAPDPTSTATTDTSSDESSNTTAPVSEEVPMTDHCELVADWDPEWSQWEDEVLLLVNDYRAEGADCGTEGEFGPAEPLEMDPILRCSSRLHSLDMFERMYFDHTNPDGDDPFVRMEDAGFSGSYMGENIAMGQTDPVEVMEAWIDSDGHCSNVLSPNFTLIGVGYYPGAPEDFRARNYWTQNFGAPRMQFGGGGRN